MRLIIFGDSFAHPHKADYVWTNQITERLKVKEQINYAATDVIHLHEIREKLDEILERQNRRKLVQACIEFLPTRVELDLRGWNNDIFSHSS